ncbi:MAG: hypothetical protein ABL857_03985 [Rickettsiales bacterium]|jgi:hypothetical protein
MKKPAIETRKITVNLPVSLIESLMCDKENNLTETIKKALIDYKHHRACQELLDMQGKVKFMLTAEELKELRD